MTSCATELAYASSPIRNRLGSSAFGDFSHGDRFQQLWCVQVNLSSLKKIKECKSNQASVWFSATAAILALLEDDSDRTIQSYALERLHENVPLYWAEMSNAISRIEELYEDESFPDRQLAALVASKVYYHLGALDEALAFALGAGNLFKVDDVQDQYVETIIGAFILVISWSWPS